MRKRWATQNEANLEKMSKPGRVAPERPGIGDFSQHC